MSYKKKGLWLLLPGLAGFLIFYIIPFIYCFYYSTIDNTFSKKFVGIKNYIDVIGNKYFRLALRNTFEFTVIGVPLLMLISFILAVLLISASQKLRLSRAAFVIPILIPSAAIVMIWQILFGDSSIIMRQFFSSMDMLKGHWLQKIPIFLFFIWKNAGYDMILFTAGLASIPRETYEACEIDGAGTFRKHMHITLPLLMPTTFFVLVISMVNSFKIFKEVFLLYGAYPSETIYIVQHYMNNHFSKMNYQNLTTGAIIFAFIVYIIVAAMYKLENRTTKGVW